LITSGEPERISGMRVSSNFFHLLGVKPAIGRDFNAADDTPARWRSVILSDGLWRRRFGADPAAVGRVVSMNDQQFTIVGVMPPSFGFAHLPALLSAADRALSCYERSLNHACRGWAASEGDGRLAQHAARNGPGDIDAVQAQPDASPPSEYPPPR
jgi:hypothetical protein